MKQNQLHLMVRVVKLLFCKTIILTILYYIARHLAWKHEKKSKVVENPG